MKQQKTSKSDKFKRGIFFFLALFYGLALGAQTVSWQTNPHSPSLTANTIGVLSEDIFLDLKFIYGIPLGQDNLENAKSRNIRLILPAGVTVESAEPGSGGQVGSNITIGEISQIGTEVTIPITSITYNLLVHLRVRLQANDCSNFASGDIDVTLSNGSLLDASEASVPLAVVKPEITATPLNADLNATDANDPVDYEISLWVINNVSVPTMKITISKDKFTTLSDFFLGTQPIVPESVSETDVVLKLTKNLVGNTPISDNHRQNLKFKGKSSVSGVRLITAASDFPESGTVCVTNPALFSLKLTVPVINSDKASLNFTATSAAVLTQEPSSGEAMPLAFDASHVNYYRSGYIQNNGKATITRLRVRMIESHGDNAYKIDSYIDQDYPVYYSVSASATPPTIASPDIKAIDKVRDNCIYRDTLPKYGHMRILKDEFLTECSTVEFDIPESLPPGYYLYIYVPHVIGQTFDNSDWTEIPVIANNRSYNITGNKVTGFVDGWDMNGNTPAVTGYPDMGRYYHPVFLSEAISTFSVQPGQTPSVEIPFSVMGVSGGAAFKYSFYIRVPEWMELLGTPMVNGQTFATAGSQTLLAPGDTYYVPGYNTYTFEPLRISGNKTVIFNYQVKAQASYSYPANRVREAVYYWVDWDTGVGVQDNEATAVDEKALRPVITYIAKTMQNVTCVVNSTGVEMTGFHLNRLTRGLAVKTKDGSGSADNRTPDNGALPGGSAPLAATEDINHEMYLPEDSGEVKIEAQIMDAATYKYLYVLLSSDYIPHFKFTKFNLDRSSLLISGNTYPANALVVDGTRLYVRFSAATTFPAATANITLPFEADTTLLREVKPLEAEVYVTTTAPGDPFNPGALRNGYELLVYNWGIHHPFGLTTTETATPVTTLGSASTNIHLGYYTNSYSGVNRNSYSYPNEYRPFWHPWKVNVKLPVGIIPSELLIQATNYPDITKVAKNMQRISSSQTIDIADTVTYVYDISSVFDFSADSYEKAQQAVLDDKWIAPDDATYYTVWIAVTASPKADVNGIASVEWINKVRPSFTSTDTIRRSVRFFNSNIRGKLDIPDNNFTAYERDITISSVVASVIDPASTTTVRPAWLYVDGNVENISLQAKDQALPAPVVNGRWISLGSTGLASNYALKYTLKGNNPETVVDVYLIADFDNSGLNPDENEDIATFIAGAGNEKYIGGKKSITTLLSGDAKLQGQIVITSPSGVLVYDDPYNVEISINSKGGGTSVINPVISLTVPSGQVHIPGDGLYEYPAGSGAWNEIPADAITSTSPLTINTSAFENSNGIILYGNRVIGKESSDRTLNLKLSFKPDCQTSFNGVVYSVSFSGKNLFGENATGVNNLPSNKFYTNVASAYSVVANTSFELNDSVFGGNDIRKTLLIEVYKYAGIDPFAATDYLELQIPCWLELAEDIITTTAAPELAAIHNLSVREEDIDNHLSGNRRIIQIKLPVTALNATTDNGYGMPFTYRIPLIYKEDNRDEYLTKNPVQTVETNVYTLKRFSPGEECPGVPYPLVSELHRIVLLTLETPNPYPATFASACIGKPFEMKITSAGFSGGWYSDAGLNIPITGDKSYIYTPKTTESKNFYIKADINSTSYGKILVTVKTPPVNLYWSASATDSDWNNPANWSVGSAAGSNPNGFLPALCTEVQLPASGTNYPLLTDSAGCGLVDFPHGAILGRQDLLHYDSAKVELRVNANRWYLFSPPLRNFDLR
jgi:hypothetical protein